MYSKQWKIWLALVLTVMAYHTATAQVRLVKPVGGEVYDTDRDVDITAEWTGVDPTTPVAVSLSSDAGMSWTRLIDSARGMSYTWALRDWLPGDEYRVRLQVQGRVVETPRFRIVGDIGNAVDLAWEPNGERVATGVAVWNGAANPLQINKLSPTGALSVDWSTDGRSILVVATNGDVVFYDASTYGEVGRRRFSSDPVGSWAREARWQPNGTAYAVARGVNVEVYADLLAERPAYILRGERVVDNIVWSPDGRYIAVTRPGLVRVERLGDTLRVDVETSDRVCRPVWSAASDKLACARKAGEISIWNAGTNGVSQYDFRSDAETACMTFIGETTDLAVASESGLVVVLQLSSVTRRYVASLGSAMYYRESALVSRPDGSYLAAGTHNGKVILMNMETGFLRNRTAEEGISNTLPIVGLRWNPQGTAMVAVSAKQEAYYWGDTTATQTIVASADSSAGNFTIIGPKPDVARFAANGGRVELGDTVDVAVRLAGSAAFVRSGIDSMAVTVTFDGSMLSVVDAAGGTTSASGSQRTIVLPTVALPLGDDSVVARLRLRAVLGRDSVTSVTVSDVRTINRRTTPPPVTFETDAEAIVITDICREGGEARLYDAGATTLALRGRRTADGGIAVDVDLSDDGAATLQLVDGMGRVLVMETATADERRQRRMVRHYETARVGSAWVVAVLVSETQRRSVVIGQ